MLKNLPQITNAAFLAETSQVHAFKLIAHPNVQHVALGC